MKKSIVNYPYLTEPVEIYERENGHKIVLAHKDGDLVNISSWVKTGSINETDKNNGISHFLEHLMFKGTERFKVGEFDRILEGKGGIVNAATWKDYTFYHVTLPKGENDENLYLAIDLHSDMMTNIVLPEDEIGAPFDLNDTNIKDKRERHVVIEEIRMRKDQNWTKVYNACNFNMYTNHPYKRDVIGTPEIISQVTRDEIYNYYKTFYTPDNITTIVVGDFDKEKVLDAVIKAFDFKTASKAPQITRKEDKPTSETKIIENKTTANTGYVMFGWLGPKASQLKENIILDLLSIILGDGTSSRLYQNLIEKQADAIINYADCSHYQFKDGNNFFVQASFNPEKKDEVISLIKQELDNLLEVKITDKELQKAKKKTKSNFAEGAETVSDISETIGYYATVCDDIKLVEEYLKDLENITTQDIEDAVKTYLNMNNAVISILMPEA